MECPVVLQVVKGVSVGELEEVMVVHRETGECVLSQMECSVKMRERTGGIPLGDRVAGSNVGEGGSTWRSKPSEGDPKFPIPALLVSA